MDHFNGLDPFRYKDQPLFPIQWLKFDHSKYPVCSFSEYPILRGWSLDAVQVMKRAEVDTAFCKDTLPMLQSWLFLGALESIIKCRIQSDKYIRIRRKQEIISTRFLVDLWKDWRSSTKSLPVHEKENRCREIAEVLSEIQTWCLKLGNWQENDIDRRRGTSIGVRTAPNEVDSVCVLLTLVGGSINTERTFLQESRSLRRGFMGCYTAESENRLAHRLVACGWCPFMARILFTYGYSVAEFARYFNTKEPPWRTHKRCSPLYCVAYKVDEASYQPRHDIHGCSCSHLKPPLYDVTALLRRGKIPVISIEGQQEVTSIPRNLKQGNISLQVSDSSEIEAFGGYAAYSHVWSDRMGSTTEKGLPTCLVASLFERAHALGFKYIWIDSLCVPEQDDARIQAIILMNATYKNCAVTIVLDSHIRQKYFNDDGWPPLEITLLAIVTSPWMQRLWTLPETILPARLIFQFRNTLASSKDIHDAIIDYCQQDFNPVIQTLSMQFLRMLMRTDILGQEFGKEIDLAQMLHMLRLRSTSRASDEVIAIADLLDLDVKPLLAAKNDLEQQRKLFFQALGRVPSDIIFTSTPRMTSPGFRWAPLSFLANDKIPDIRRSCATRNRNKLARCLPAGRLLGSYQVSRLSRPCTLQYAIAVTILHGQVPKKVTMAKTEDVAKSTKFDAFAMLPHTSGVEMALQVAAAMVYKDESVDGLPMYEYQGRILVGDSTMWPSNPTNRIDVYDHQDEVEIILL
ncbi:uncharacterized protein F4807DRAFT_263405 [Annulohypoxylon truncatum]|uniref:uncharacterized protein n=1 Tax=Annulohypoxylon truncatum TaxID=327061 RepID=UPI0020078BAD|nr:uncharacterized protein F4807DRAFT_263405 [Annulohypoxylon truncatum]KAI1213382.1 hypothetical protein F4807DRAFT_263405 [Annulohypoxylon truncatum]